MVEKYQRIWDDAINRLKSNISQQSFDMFFSTPKKVYKVKNNKMYVIVQNNMWWKNINEYGMMLSTD